MIDRIQIELPTHIGVALYAPGAAFGPRINTDFEFVWIIEGCAEYSCDGHIFAAPEGTVILCRPGCRDYFQWDRHRRTRHAFFHFQITQLPPDWPPVDEWPVLLPMPDDDILRHLFRHLMVWLNNSTPAHNLATVEHMLLTFTTGHVENQYIPANQWPDAIERVTNFVFKQLDEDTTADLSLKVLADVACVTPEYLCRIFRQHMQLSPAEMVRHARLDLAKTMLTRSNYSLNEISESCGFANAFHLSRLFKEAFGQTPSEVRKRVRSGATPPLPLLTRTTPDIVVTSPRNLSKPH